MTRKGPFVSKTQKQTQKVKFRLIAAGFAIFGLACLSFFIYLNFGVQEKAKAAAGKDGAAIISTPNEVVNEFTTLTSNVSVGDNKVYVTNNNLNSNSRFSCSLTSGDLVLIIQMQGASIGTSDAATYGAISSYNNAGKYELAEVSSTSGSNRINLTKNLKNAYTVSGKVQVVRVPRYTSLVVDVGASLTTPNWDGATGGVLCMEVNGSSVINGTVDVSGKGFRGGSVKQVSTLPGNHTIWRSTTSANGGEKGESIAGNTTTYDGLNGRYGRGAPANGGGGGNSHNAAGGGGANGGVVASWNGKGNPDLTNVTWAAIWNLEGGSFSSNTSSGGGRGGYTYSANSADPLTKAPGDNVWGGDNRFNVGGYGGRPLDYSGGRVFMGGGGGAGDSNDGTGTSGARGGGIVIITSGLTVSGTGTINADGADVAATTGPNGRDGSGGGGGGGAIIIYTRGGNVSNLNLYARGGDGGSQDLTVSAEAEGAGGSGGGGFIAVTASSGISTSVVSGAMGTSNSISMTAFTPNGGTRGFAGGIGSPPSNPYSSSTSLPVELILFDAKVVDQSAILSWKTASEKNNNFFNIERSADGKVYEVVGMVKGAGNSITVNSYSLTDQRILPGVSYYRLKQTDFDGRYEYFKVVKIESENEHSTFDNHNTIISVGPNPFNDSFNAEFNASHAGKVEVQISDLKGQLVHREQIETSGGNTVYVFHQPRNLVSGIYFIRIIQDGKSSRAFKIIKK